MQLPAGDDPGDRRERPEPAVDRDRRARGHADGDPEGDERRRHGCDVHAAVTSPPGFTTASARASLTVNPGETKSYTVTITRTDARSAPPGGAAGVVGRDAQRPQPDHRGGGRSGRPDAGQRDWHERLDGVDDQDRLRRCAHVRRARSRPGHHGRRYRRRRSDEQLRRRRPGDHDRTR